MLLLIPLLPLLGFLLNASFGRRVSKPVAGAIACGAMLASFAVSLASVAQLVALPPDARAITQQVVHLDHARATSRVAFTLRLDPLVGGDDPRRHRHRLADPHLLDGVHARRARFGVRALLLVPESVRRVHARARPRLELPRDVRRLGGRRPLLVSADRLLVREEVRLRRRQEGVHRQPHRRLRLHPRRAARVRPLRHARFPADRARGRRRSARKPRSARCRSSRCCCSSAPPASPRRFRCTSGCRTRWKARRRCPR